MSVDTVLPRERRARLSLLDRALAITPLASVYFWLVLVYAAEAVKHRTPTIFTDELKWTQFARGIADHGFASIRGERVGFQSLYVYLLAPAWLVHDTATAYSIVKYVNVLTMPLAVVPAYLLARRLVSKPSALLAAAATGAIPSMAYALAIVPEVVAYPWSVLCAWLIVEALAGRGRRWTAAAVAASVVAPLVRGQLIVVPAAFAGAAFAMWWRSDSGRRLRRHWTRADVFGAALLAIGLFVILNRWIGNGNGPWHLTTDNPQGRAKVYDQVVWAFGALSIGVGVLPMLGGLISLVPRRGERLTPYDRAFIATTSFFLGVFAIYTGVKGAYLSLTFATRVTERNMIYVSPLLFVGTAIVLERRRIGLASLAIATGVVAYVIVATPLQLDWPYFEALGFSIASMSNRYFYWSSSGIRVAVLVVLGIAVAALGARWLLRRQLDGASRRAAVAAAAVLGALVVGWNLTGEINASIGSNDFSRRLLANLPQPTTWIDDATHGGKVTYLGQQVREFTGENLLEFWNRSIVNVWSIDGTAPLPGPILTPNLDKVDGTLSNPPGTPYVLTDNGVKVVGRIVASRGNLILYAINGPIRLSESQTGVYPDGWIGSDAAYNRFETPGHRAGVVRVTLSRLGFGGDAPPGHATVTVGSLDIGPDKEPGLGVRWTRRTAVVHSKQQVNLDIPVGKPPWRVLVHLTPTFKPSDYGVSDGRELGVVVGFRFIPS